MAAEALTSASTIGLDVITPLALEWRIPVEVPMVKPPVSVIEATLVPPKFSMITISPAEAVAPLRIFKPPFTLDVWISG